MIRFKIDENLPIEVAEVLREAGHDAVTAGEQALSGRPDPQLAQVCRDEKRALVTLDLDFADIRAYPPEKYSGIVVLRSAVQSIPSLTRLASRMVALLTSEPLAGRLWIVDEAQVRVRGDEPGSP